MVHPGVAPESSSLSRAANRAFPTADHQASIDEGDRLFGTECGQCHGLDGHKATDAGGWMYPLATDLPSTEVQRYSDRELFWVVKNGIRLSGMPGFGKVEPAGINAPAWVLATSDPVSGTARLHSLMLRK